MCNFLSVGLCYFYLHSFFSSAIANSDEILGCGGYIKSEVEINYSQVRIKLLTQQRNLKFETECAPNNGYYFIPLYDKGDYILKVAPPIGWSFEPEEVSLKVDGETDPCSQSQDINFIFKGFAVVGKVVTVGSDDGPPGVTVILKQDGKQIAKTITEENGSYIFTSLGAGSYTLIASHPKWDFIKKQVLVTIKDKKGDAGNALIVGGFSLSGSISIFGDIAENVKMILHSFLEVDHKLGCEKEKPTTYKTEIKIPVLCNTGVDKKGNYLFSNLPVGKYTIVPHFTSSNIKYDIEPPMTDVYMSHNDYQVREVFKIKGRSLRGRILMEKNGPPINDAKVTLNKDLRVKTNAEGYFYFENIKFGDYLIQASSDGVDFEDVRFKLDIDFPDVNIVPTRYETCFVVSMDSASSTNIPWLINIEGENSKHEIQTGASGSGCLLLKPGEYKAYIVLTQQDEEAGIRFGPSEIIFKVENKPVRDLLFSQFLGEIHGTLECLETCKALTVSLRLSKGNSGSPRTTTAIQGKFIFKEVVPAKYLLSVDKEEWCWKEKSIIVSVNAKNVSVKFEQTGFRLTINSSHPTTLSFVTNQGHSGKLKVSKGTSRECVSAPGKYVFTPLGCQKFRNAPLTWDTSSLQLLSLIASHHKVTGSLLSSEPGPFTITVESNKSPQYVVGPLAESPTKKNVYPFELWLESGESATLTPKSSSNLFQYFPPSFSVEVSNKCLFAVVQFQAERGLFIKGSVLPSIKGVTINVFNGDTKLKFTTNDKGVFIAGPLNRLSSYTVTAEKSGYIFQPPKQETEVDSAQKLDIIKMNFKAFQLPKINVMIKDESDQPLEGVLISVSGGKNYRQNSLSNKEGKFTFESLMPSDYFLKPMMKEYNFNPPSFMANVGVGEVVNVDIKGVRVAYSIFGQTISLNGEPEGEVTVEAIGIGQPCLEMQEEALSDSQGNFRIRGLTDCEYKIRLKKGEGVNPHLDRALPKERVIQISKDDFKGLKIVVMRPFLQMDVAVTVDTDRQYLSSLSAEIYRDDSPDSPVHIVSMGQNPFFMLPPMVIDYRTYTVQLVSSLPSNQYSYKPTSVSFTANSSFVKLSLSFKPKFKSIDAEISRGTVFGLIFFVLAVGVALNYNKLEPYIISFAVKYLNNSSTPSKVGKSTQSSQVSDVTSSDVGNVRKRVKVRKT